MIRIKKEGSLGTLAALGLALALAALPAAATDVTPTVVSGNPSCQDLGYELGFKVEPPQSGTYDIDGTNSVTVSTDGTYFDWTSTLGVDAVVVKGGLDSNLYVYDPPAEAFADTGLHSPEDPGTGHVPALSHIEFCYDAGGPPPLALDVAKTAQTTFTRTYGWEIVKSVEPETWDLFTGDSGTSLYTVAVFRDDGTDSDWMLTGTITITNNTAQNATIESVTDLLSGFGSVTVDCAVTFPYVLAPGASLECDYSTALLDGTARLNTVTVTTSGEVAGGEAVADVVFGEPTTLVNDTVDVDDSVVGSLGTFTDDGQATYQRTFTCPADAGDHDNTATIVGTGLSDSQTVTVRCYDLSVTKTAATSLGRVWSWTIDKSASESDLVLADGQLYLVNYTVALSATDHLAYVVSGDIWITNPAPVDAELVSVTDLISPDLAATVVCPSLTVPAGGSLHCTYWAELPDDSDRLNTATATLQNYAFDSAGGKAATGTTDYTGTAAVMFDPAAPADDIDECVDVSDTNVGFLGTICQSDVAKTLMYSLWFGAHPDANVVLACGENTHLNTASFVAKDTGATGSDDWTVNANVTCEQVSSGCTLTPGYWKTHSGYGRPRYDDAWDLIQPSGPNTTFFLSGQTYYQVLWTDPSENAYYILAHAYIAAELNQLNGASIPSAVLAAFNQAETLLSTYTPGQLASLPGDDPVRQQFVSLATVLDDYNNGLTGPGACSD